METHHKHMEPVTELGRGHLLVHHADSWHSQTLDIPGTFAECPEFVISLAFRITMR